MNAQPHTAAHTALEILKKLRSAGHAALLAGGCVRDMLLNRAPKDYDVATDATPDRVQSLFPKARFVGAKFGVVLVHKSGFDIEVATFRSDGPYSDGRHPDEVTFGTEIEDARRRDFTINGLFFDPIDDRVIDHVGGRADLEAKLIRTIGDPDRRFAEDHLRMLRAVRFAAQLGEFTVEPATAEAIRRLAHHLPSISAERVWMELERLLTSAWPGRGWHYLVELGLVNHVIEGWKPSTEEASRIRERLAILRDGVNKAPEVGLAALFLDRDPVQVEGFCRQLRLSNRLTEDTVWILRSYPRLMDEASLELADLKTLMVATAWPSLLKFFTIQIAEIQRDKLPVLERLRKQLGMIRPEDVAPPPLLSGDDLAALGVSPGPRFGEILKKVYRAQLNSIITTRDQAHTMAGELLKS